jgi:hypothetical protein
MNLVGLNDDMRKRLDLFKQQFPNVPITSGFRSPTQNANVGGSKNSQHLDGNAIDMSLRGMSDEDQLRVLDWWKGQGAQGFGYYPNKQSIHVDYGSPRAWGPNYSRTSLNQTPQFFQNFVAGKQTPFNTQDPTNPSSPAPMPQPGYSAMGGDDSPREMMGVGPGQPPAPAEKPADPATDPAKAGGAMASMGMQLMQAGQGGKPLVDPRNVGPAADAFTPRDIKPIALGQSPMLGLLGGQRKKQNMMGLLGGFDG